MRFFAKKTEKANRALVEEIILEKYNQYYRLAYSYVKNKDDAEDIVQNGAYRALRYSHTLAKPEFAETWVYRIMLNECFRQLKRPKFLSYEAVEGEGKTEAFAEEDSYADADLRKVLDALPEKDKAIIILKYYEDKTLEEIADILEENVNTVKSRLYRSMRKLRKTLTEEADGSECM